MNVQPKNINLDLEEMARHSATRANVYGDVGAIISDISQQAKAGDHVVIMSNGAFNGIHEKLLARLSEKR